MKQTFHCARCKRCRSCAAALDLYLRRRRAYQAVYGSTRRAALERGVGLERARELGRKAARRAAEAIR